MHMSKNLMNMLGKPNQLNEHNSYLGTKVVQPLSQGHCPTKHLAHLKVFV